MNKQEKALEDVKLIKAMMEAANRAVASPVGIFFIIFGVYWVITGSVWYIPGFKESFRSAPRISVPLWIGFILICTILLTLYTWHRSKREKYSGPPWRIEKQILEITVLMLVIGPLSSFLTGHLHPGPGIRFFLMSLVIGLGFYFIGVAWVPEFRIVGLSLFVGMVLLPFVKGYEQLIHALTFGSGMILAGSFMHRRWLKLKRSKMENKD
jgi:hypothetical protein